VEYEYEHEEAPGNLDEGECEGLGGEEVAAACPSADRAGMCQEADDCHEPTYVFYESFEGGVFDADDLAAAEERCLNGDVVGCDAVEWVL
jgi:hypothetical protein